MDLEEFSADDGVAVVRGKCDKKDCLSELGDGRPDSGEGRLRRGLEEKEWLFCGRTEVMMK
jgi:hypothetical protein